MLSKVLSNYITRLKGHQYKIDTRIPATYLLSLMVNRLIMKWRGRLSRIRSGSPLFIGRRVTLKARSMMSLGSGVSLDRGCHIDALSDEGVRFGNNVSVGRNTIIECTGSIQHLGKGIKVGDNTGLGSDNFYGCAGGIEIGRDTIVGNFVSFHAENHIFSDLHQPIRLQGVSHQGIRIGNNCWIGAKCTILDGVIIEDDCILAAGAIAIAGIYRKNGIYGGVPAKLIKYRT